LQKPKIRNPLKYSELFCGPGGMGLGAKLASDEHKKHKIEHLWATDSDKQACITYARNICGNENDESVIHSYVEELDYNDLKSPAPDILSFGFPCNDYSLVGEKKGINGYFGPLYTFGVKGLNEFNPLIFVAENVSGIRSSNEGEAFLKILKELRQAGKGYELTTNEFHFEKYGIPQKRHRVVIVGFRKDSGLKFEVPAETHDKTNWVTVSRALTNPAIKKNDEHHIFTNNTLKVQERLSLIPEGKNIWDVQEDEDFPDELRLNVKKVRLSQIYKRLHSKEPSYTVTGSGGGGTHMYHWKENRALTNRERARIQTFPDWYSFSGGKEDIRKQIGMAVPVEGAKIIFKAVLDTISGIKYECQDPSIR